MLQLTLLAEPEAVRVALVRVSAGLEGQGIAAERAAAAEIVLAEILNNVVEHAFRSGPPGPISVTVCPARGAILCEVRDGGRPMPGGCLPGGQLPAGAGTAGPALPEGGFGWFLIRSLAEGLDYRREGGENVLRFRLPLAAPLSEG